MRLLLIDPPLSQRSSTVGRGQAVAQRRHPALAAPQRRRRCWGRRRSLEKGISRRAAVASRACPDPNAVLVLVLVLADADAETSSHMGGGHGGMGMGYARGGGKGGHSTAYLLASSRAANANMR